MSDEDFKKLCADARKRKYRKDEGFFDHVKPWEAELEPAVSKIVVKVARRIAKAAGVPLEIAAATFITHCLVSHLNKLQICRNN